MWLATERPKSSNTPPVSVLISIPLLPIPGPPRKMISILFVLLEYATDGQLLLLVAVPLAAVDALVRLYSCGSETDFFRSVSSLHR